MDIWELLFRFIVPLQPRECFGLQKFVWRWLLQVIGMPTLVGLIVSCPQLYRSGLQRYRRSGTIHPTVTMQIFENTKDKATGDLKSNLFFVIFFTYPSICIACFTPFICRQLTPEMSVLELDDTTTCESSGHTVLKGISAVVIAVFSIGPVILFFYFRSKAKDWKNNQCEKYHKPARRMHVELGVDLKEAEFVIRDIIFGRDYSMLMDAFRPRYLYWEALDMVRKLFLVGLVLVFGRGSVAQLASAATISFAFFALHIKAWPYKTDPDNWFRAATELHVFIAITTAMVLKSNLDMEAVTEDFYGPVLFWSFIVFVPLAFGKTVWNKVQRMTSVMLDLSTPDADPFSPRLDEHQLDLLRQRRRAFELHVLGLGGDAEKDTLQRFIDGWAISKDYAAFLCE
eukprot:COSAG01_NODE_76_length_28332_cov_298.876992_18_plen_399_part_00